MVDIGNLTDYLAIIAPMATGLTMIVAVFLARRGEKDTSLKRRPVKQASPEDERIQKKVEAIRKKDPKVFYYLDKQQVEDLHAQIEQRQLMRVERTKTSQGEKGIEARVSSLGASYKKGGKEETREVYEVRQQRATMYNIVEDHLIEKKKLSLGAEDFVYDESRISEFDDLRTQIKDKCEFDIPDDVRLNFVKKTMGEFAKAKIVELADSNGYVGISSEFSVGIGDDDSYRLELIHPLNQYIASEESKVKIVVKCLKANMTSLGHDTFQRGRSVKLVCVGNVVSWNEDQRSLEVNPIALY